VITADKGFPGGLELRTPILDVFPHSQWRSHVRECWDFLERYYRVTGDERCGTHIHISLVPNFDLTELKRIACAIIQFEPAFEALMPSHRRGNAYATSNWLSSPYLKRRGRSRAQSIDDIEKAFDVVEVFRLIQGYHSSNFCWNFRSLFESKQTMEFRQPPASSSLAEVLSWAELTMNFIQASIRHGSSVRNFAANVGGLRSFLEQINVDGVNEPGLMQRIWGNKPNGAAAEPVDISGEIMEGMDEVDKVTEETAEVLRRLYVRRLA
jgi:Putative amidoligase enzyme